MGWLGRLDCSRRRAVTGRLPTQVFPRCVFSPAETSFPAAVFQQPLARQPARVISCAPVFEVCDNFCPMGRNGWSLERLQRLGNGGITSLRNLFVMLETVSIFATPDISSVTQLRCRYCCHFCRHCCCCFRCRRRRCFRCCPDADVVDWAFGFLSTPTSPVVAAEIPGAVSSTPAFDEIPQGRGSRRA